MTYEVARQMKAVVEARCSDAGAVLKAIPGLGSGPMGLTPDHVKASPAYRAAKQDADATFAVLRRYNAWFMREYGREYRNELKAERAAKLATRAA